MGLVDLRRFLPFACAIFASAMGMLLLFLPIGGTATAAPLRTGGASDDLVSVQIVDNGRVAWLDRDCRIYCDEDGSYEGRLELTSARPDGRKRRTVLSRPFGAQLDERGVLNSFALSSQALAFFTGDFGSKDGGSGTGRIEFGTHSGLSRPVLACSGYVPPILALDRSTLVFSDCDEARTRVFVASVDGLRKVLYDQPGPGPASGLAIRDGYVAIRTASWDRSRSVAVSNRLVVLDTAGRQVMSFEAGSGRRVGAFALGADGAIVMTGSPKNVGATACRSALCWASPQSPMPRAIAVNTKPAELRFDGRTVVFSTVDRDLYSVGVNGGERRVVDMGKVSPKGDPFFDADGRRVTYARETCSGRSVIRTLQLPAVARVKPRRCRLGFARPRRVRLQGRSIVVRFTCPRGCRGKLVTRRGRRLATKYSYQEFSQSRRRGRHRIELAPRLRRLIRRRGRLTVTVKAKVQQLATADRRVVARYFVVR